MDIRRLETMAYAVAHLMGSTAPLIVFAGPATLWVWCHTTKVLDLNELQDIARRFPTLRAAIGSPIAGIGGFRRSHLEALTTQRLLGRLTGAPAVATIDQVRMVSLMTHDARAARQFVLRTLGRLATDSVVLQRSLHAFWPTVVMSPRPLKHCVRIAIHCCAARIALSIYCLSSLPTTVFKLQQPLNC